MNAPHASAPVRDRTTVRPTTFGVVLAVLLLVSFVLRPAVADPSVVGLVWAGLAGALLFGVVWPVLTVRTLGLRVLDAPTDLVVDQLGSIEVELTGRASGLTLGCTGQAMKVVDAVSPGRVRLPVTIFRRGAYRRIRVDLGSDAPFGVVAVTRSRLLDLPRELLVGPMPVPAVAQLGDLVGEQAAPRPTGGGVRGDAVRSVRPYVAGDPAHLVHWPSSARTGALVVRELEPPATRAVAVVVDLGEAADGPSAAVEHAAGRAAGLAASALEQGARVLLCTSEAGGPVMAEAADRLAVQRRLALATTGRPATPPPEWAVVHVEPTAGERPDRPGSGRPVTITPPGGEPQRRRASRRRVAPDRRTISNLRVWTVTALVGVQLWASLSALPSDSGRNLAAEAATLCAVLAIFGLRSVPIRWIVRGAAVLSGLLLARFGELSVFGGLTGSWRVLLWLAATAAALVLAPSSRSVIGAGLALVVNAADLPTPSSTTGGAASTLARGSGAAPADPVGAVHDAPARPGSVPVALLIAAVALIGAASLLVGPRMANGFPVGAKAGEVIDFGQNRADNALTARDSLDMTRRPRLSDEVVMTVRSPITSFWRTELFDVWDGANWTRSRGREGAIVRDGQVVADEHDIAASDGDSSTQEFRIDAGFATAVPAAPSAVQVDSPGELVQRSDGTLLSSFDPLGSGTTYTVQSRQVPVDARMLRAASARDVPEEIRRRYASPTVATERVVALARQVTAGATNDYDRILALEGWMNANTEYSLDAPLSPEGVDVVDHFLFTERLGWCEQIASSLVVMARSVGVPARLATGFAPGEWDAVGGRFVVRERDAHAWAEVWFPGAGWVPFDPTASVPLSGTAEATAGAAARDWREVAGGVLLVVGVAALAGGWARRAWRRRSARRAQRRRRRQLARDRWDVAEELRLEQLGQAAGRPRGPGETATSYAAALAELTGEAELEPVGAGIDRERYAPPSADPEAPSSMLHAGNRGARTRPGAVVRDPGSVDGTAEP